MLLKSFRLFVSSTFKDFAQERERLQSEVFPALDAYCAARGYQFHAVDLRWGVNEEAQLDQRTAEICLGEVSAAKSYPAPNFLVMIGDRYSLWSSRSTRWISCASPIGPTGCRTSCPP